MSGPRISDHALVNFLERMGGLNVETLRTLLQSSFDRAHSAARSISDSDYLILADRMVYVVRGDTVTAILPDENGIGRHASALTKGREQG